MKFIDSSITHKNNVIDFYQEDCDQTNLYFIEKLNEVNSQGKGRYIPNSLPDVHGAVWAKYNESIVGGLFYDIEKAQGSNSLWIVLVYVDPKYRQQGIYKMLHQQANALAKSLGREKVITWFSLANQKMFQIGKSVGYSGTMVIMERPVD